MNTVLLVICIFIGILICVMSGVIIYCLTSQKGTIVDTPVKSSVAASTPVIVNNVLPAEENSVIPNIPIERISALTESEEKEMYEITDEGIKQRVLQIVPEATKILGNASIATMANSTGPLYQAIIPAGTTLVESRNIPGAFRGYVMENGRILKQADLLESTVGKQIATIGLVNVIVGVTSVVVGQYYMSCISSDLKEINKQINEISQFQDEEYRSKVIALGMEIQHMSNFQLEIFDKPEILNRELDHLRRLGYECSQLLEQANLRLSRISDRYLNSKDYDTYRNLISNAIVWRDYQEILLKLLCKISEMIYALYQGTASVDYCGSIFEPHRKQTSLVSVKFDKWQENSAKIFGIDYGKGRRKRNGILWRIGSLLFDDIDYQKIDEKTMNEIKRIREKSNEVGRFDLYSQDVRIIVQGNRMYYLPMKKIQAAIE